jgi:SAM-dependent methyltransferase
MLPSAYDLKEYYGTPQGQGVLHLLLKRLKAWWPDSDLHGETMVGSGFAIPYLEQTKSPPGVFALLSGQMGAMVWPAQGRQRVMLANHGQWPLPSAGVDYILMVHELEYAEDAGNVMEEAWRALKPEGRLIIIVPNRTGLWARAEKTPFGHGRPFTAMQLHDLLRDHNFSLERSSGALLAPPFKSPALINKVAPFIEHLAPVAGALCGVIVAEASKRLYSPIRGKPKPAAKPALIWGEPAAAGPAGRMKHV